jgi:tRNA-dihydrouridine synthase B
MIGRTAPSNPWIFRQIEQYCSDADHFYQEPTEADRYQMIRTYFQMLIEEELPDAVGKMKQFASWFTHGVPGGAHLRKEIYESKSAPEILARVETFFEARLFGGAGLVRETV